MLQAQDLVLGFARFLGGSFAGSRAAGVSTDASGVLTSKKTVPAPKDDREVDELDGPSPKKKISYSKKACAKGGVDTKYARSQERVGSRFVWRL